MSLVTLKTAGFVNISYCVNEYLLDKEDFTDMKREKATQYAIKALSSFNIFEGKNVEVAYLNMDANGLVSLSTLTDYIDYIKIGIIIRGKLWILSVNPKIALRRTEISTADAAGIFNGSTREDITEGYYFAGHYNSGSYVSTMYGYGGGLSRSYFRYDNESNNFQFDTAVPNSRIVIEYLSTGVKLTGATTIPRSMVDYIVAYIHWRMKFHEKGATEREIARYKIELLEQENMLTDLIYQFDLDQYLDLSYAAQHQGVKR